MLDCYVEADCGLMMVASRGFYRTVRELIPTDIQGLLLPHVAFLVCYPLEVGGSYLLATQVHSSATSILHLLEMHLTSSH
jgi:hypothetical protein